MSRHVLRITANLWQTAMFVVPIVNAQSPSAHLPQTPAGTAFTYQGRLTDNDSPAAGTYEFQFKLFDASGSGFQIGSALTVNDLSMMNGMFTAQLDFGMGAFNGDARWLDISVRSGTSSSGYTTRTPRQPMTAAPYALDLVPPVVITTAAPLDALKIYNSNGRTAYLYINRPGGFSSPNIDGGHSNNAVFAGVRGATIAGGGGGPLIGVEARHQ